jgi:hypothetical protein
MQTNTSEFTNLTAFARAVAEHMKDSLGGRATDRRLLNSMKPPSTAALRSIASRRGSCAIASVGCASINAGVSTLRTLMNGSTATESRSPRRRRHEPEACDQANQGTVWPFSWEASLLLADELLERMASDAGNDLAKNLAEPILNDCSPNGNGSMSERNYRPTGHQAPAALLHISRLTTTAWCS